MESNPTTTEEFPAPRGPVVTPPTVAELLALYVQSFTPLELKAYHVAISYLKDAFDLERSVGFIEWKAEYLKPPPPSSPK